jgi:ferredoxin
MAELTGRNGERVRVYVDPDVCQGHTLCNMAAPEIFKLRAEDGHGYVELTSFTPEQLVLARKAQSGCPEGAILIEE